MTTIRRALPEDASAIARIAQEAHALHAGALPAVFQPATAYVVTTEDIARLLADSQFLVLVALVGDVVGYAHAEVRNADATVYKQPQSALHVIAMAVAASHRGRGVGQALLRALQDEAASRGVRELSLEVYAFNTAARAFYEKAGFMPLREYLTLPLTAGPTPMSPKLR